MTKMIFISLPVTDLQASIAFYEALGFQQNPQMSDDSSACMVWTETIQAMLLTHAKWRTFTDRPLPPPGSSAVMLSLSVDSREAVDAMNRAAAAHGGQADVNPVQDLGFSCTAGTSPTPTATCGARSGRRHRRCPMPAARVSRKGHGVGGRQCRSARCRCSLIS